jgi:tetratricopeptide (TPR) repeat protein
LWEPLVTEFRRVPAYRQHLADARSGLGKLLRANEKPEEEKEAEEQFRKSIALRRELVPELPADHEIRDHLAGDHEALSRLLMKRGERKEGEAQLRLALAVREKLVADVPEVAVYQTRLGGVASNFGRYLFNAGRLEESLTWLDLAVRTLTASHERDRESATDRQFLSNSHANRGFVHHRLKRHGDAIKDWNRVIELGTAGNDPSARVWRAAALVHTGPVAEAVAAADELAKSANLNPGLHCMLAGVYAQAGGKIPAKQEEYAARALELIRRAAKPGLLDPGWYAKDEDLAPLRERDDFKKLLAELQKK